jgi:hypothetical protein
MVLAELSHFRDVEICSKKLKYRSGTITTILNRLEVMLSRSHMLGPAPRSHAPGLLYTTVTGVTNFNWSSHPGMLIGFSRNPHILKMEGTVIGIGGAVTCSPLPHPRKNLGYEPALVRIGVS